MTPEQTSYLREHLPYVLKMLRYTHTRLQERQHYLSFNVHLESFAVHARNLANFLTNKGRNGTSRATDFVSGYRARKNDLKGPFQLLEDQTFHLAKRRPVDLLGKFNVEHAKAVFDWLEETMTDFLSKLQPDDRRLFDDAKSRPELVLDLPDDHQPSTTSSIQTTTLELKAPPGRFA